MVGIDGHFLGQRVTVKAKGRLFIGVEKNLVEPVFIGAALHEVSDYAIDSGILGIVGEGARVGHHARQKRLRHRHVNITGESQINQDIVEQQTGRRDLGPAHNYVGKRIGIEMMVNHDLQRLRARQRFFKTVDTTRLVEVKTEDNPGRRQQTAHGLGHFLGDVHADGGAVAQGTKDELRRAQHGRTIVGMGNDDDADLGGRLLFRHDIPRAGTEISAKCSM